MFLKLDEKLSARVPGLEAKIVHLEGVSVAKENPELEQYKDEVAERIKTRWTVEELKDHPMIRAYRDFFWKLDIDPTKNRPAAEALIRRVLRERPLYKINTFVDAYNLVSMDTAIPIASFDNDILVGELYMREALEGEEFLGIGMKKPVTLYGGEAVIQDDEKLVAIYPYRDADSSKVGLTTRNVLMLMCGAPGVETSKLDEAGKVSVEVMTRFCGGKVV
jgi:DNA/RNA-binding domain of Phe-tRNA-synthetase-like protein